MTSMEKFHHLLSLAWLPGYIALFAFIVWFNVCAVQRRTRNLSVSKAIMYVCRRGALTGDIDPSERAVLRIHIALDGTMLSDDDLDLFIRYCNRANLQQVGLLAFYLPAVFFLMHLTGG